MANWIQKAIKKPGAFTTQAKKAGMSVAEYANKVLKKGSKASTTTKRRAVLAKTLRKLAKRRKKTGLRTQMRKNPGKVAARLEKKIGFSY